MRIIVIPLRTGFKFRMRNVMSGVIGGVIPHSCCLLAMFFAGLGAAGVAGAFGMLMEFRGPLMVVGLVTSVAINRKHLFNDGKVQIIPLLMMVCVFYLTYLLFDLILS